MFISYFIFAVVVYLAASFNLACLTHLINEGYFDNPFWTRSNRAVFLVPPFAIAIVTFILTVQSVKSNFQNIKQVLKKRGQ